MCEPIYCSPLVFTSLLPRYRLNCVSQNSLCGSLNYQDLRLLPYLEIGSLQISLVKMMAYWSRDF